MTTNTRLLSGVLLAVVVTAGPATAAEYGFDAYPPQGRSPGVVPSAAPAGPPGFGGIPAGRPGGVPQPTALDRVTGPVRPAAGEVSDPYATLTGQPADPYGVPGLPPGSYPSPYFTDGPGCCGPLGRNGRIGYELFTFTGPTWGFGEGAVARRLNTGWMVGSGGRSLFFNPTHDAAWVMELSLSYQFTRGDVNDPIPVLLHRPPVTGTDSNGNPISLPRPDAVGLAGIRGLHRTNFNFGLGRDWWRWGPGAVGVENGWNVRLGGVVGGRWGTTHVDLVPTDPTLGDYQRRHRVSHGVYLASHATAEVPMGAWILFGGLRGEYGYDWMNLVPPVNGNLHNFNVLMTAGIRF